MRLKATISVGLVVALAGCGGRSDRPAVGVPVPVPTIAEVPQSYTLNPLDVIRIDVFGEPDLSFTGIPVDLDGHISFPLLGSVQVQGKTTAALAAELQAGLVRYLKQPRVAVNVTEFASQKITLAGAVARPGIVQSPGRTTLLQAIALGGGGNDDSKLSQVMIFRHQGDQVYVAHFNIVDIQEGRAADPVVQPGDIVVVGYSEARRLYRNALGVLPIAAGLFIALVTR